jgi:glycosyltransferase involved in cell wall biosynthesis
MTAVQDQPNDNVAAFVQATDETAPIDLSVVILTVDRFALADRAIASVLAQELGDAVSFELIVVDNSTRALSRERIAAVAANSRIPVRYIHVPHPNIARARNAGVRIARGEIVAFLDDDCVAPRSWAAEMLTAIEGHQADVVVGPTYPLCEGGKPPAWDPKGRALTRDSQVATGTVVDYGSGGNAFYRRATALAEAEPFDNAFGRTGGEDFDLMSRLRGRGGRIIWCASGGVAEFQPQDRMTVAYQMRKKFRANQVHVRVRMKNSRSRALACLQSMAAGVAYVLAALPRAVISLWRLDEVTMRARLRFMQGLGRLCWPWTLQHH